MSEAATTTTVKKKATPLATRTVIGSPTNANAAAEALAKTEIGLQTPPLNATTKNKATPTKYSEDVDDTFTFATPSGGNALFDNVVFASGKLG